MRMKSYAMRVDQKLSTVLETNAKQQGIKVSRYIRSLIEKGLVAESKIFQGPSTISDDVLQSTCSVTLAELSVQNLVLTRKLLRHLTETESSADEIIENAAVAAKEYVKDLLARSEGH